MKDSKRNVSAKQILIIAAVAGSRQQRHSLRTPQRQTGLTTDKEDIRT